MMSVFNQNMMFQHIREEGKFKGLRVFFLYALGSIILEICSIGFVIKNRNFGDSQYFFYEFIYLFNFLLVCIIGLNRTWMEYKPHSLKKVLVSNIITSFCSVFSVFITLGVLIVSAVYPQMIKQSEWKSDCVAFSLTAIYSLLEYTLVIMILHQVEVCKSPRDLEWMVEEEILLPFSQNNLNDESDSFLPLSEKE